MELSDKDCVEGVQVFCQLSYALAYLHLVEFALLLQLEKLLRALVLVFEGCAILALTVWNFNDLVSFFVEMASVWLLIGLAAFLGILISS